MPNPTPTPTTTTAAPTTGPVQGPPNQGFQTMTSQAFWAWLNEHGGATDSTDIDGTIEDPITHEKIPNPDKRTRYAVNDGKDFIIAKQNADGTYAIYSQSSGIKKAGEQTPPKAVSGATADKTQKWIVYYDKNGQLHQDLNPNWEDSSVTVSDGTRKTVADPMNPSGGGRTITTTTPPVKKTKDQWDAERQARELEIKQVEADNKAKKDVLDAKYLSKQMDLAEYQAAVAKLSAESTIMHDRATENLNILKNSQEYQLGTGQLQVNQQNANVNQYKVENEVRQGDVGLGITASTARTQQATAAMLGGQNSVKNVMDTLKYRVGPQYGAHMAQMIKAIGTGSGDIPNVTAADFTFDAPDMDAVERRGQERALALMGVQPPAAAAAPTGTGGTGGTAAMDPAAAAAIGGAGSSLLANAGVAAGVGGNPLGAAGSPLAAQSTPAAQPAPVAQPAPAVVQPTPPVPAPPPPEPAPAPAPTPGQWFAGMDQVAGNASLPNGGADPGMDAGMQQKRPLTGIPDYAPPPVDDDPFMRALLAMSSTGRAIPAYGRR